MSSSLSAKWESLLLNNNGHTDRKRGRQQESISFKHQALVLSPLNPTTYSALGYVQTGDITNSVESFIKDLDTNMLTSVIGQMINCVAPSPDSTPQFPSLLISPQVPFLEQGV